MDKVLGALRKRYIDPSFIIAQGDGKYVLKYISTPVVQILLADDEVFISPIINVAGVEEKSLSIDLQREQPQDLWDLETTIETMYDAILNAKGWKITKALSDLCRDIVKSALSIIGRKYINNLNFSWNNWLHNEITVQYGYQQSETTIIHITEANGSMTIAADANLGLQIPPIQIDLASATAEDVASDIETMYNSILQAKGWSMATLSRSQLNNINARAAPPHRMDNPKIAALDIEIKRSKNKLKYMEAQLFPNGLPAAKQP